MTGQQLAERGANRAAKHAGKEWVESAIFYLSGYALAGRDFTSEDIRKRFPHNPPDPRVWGAVFRKAARMGLIELTGQYRKASNKTCHARPMAVWRRKQ